MSEPKIRGGIVEGAPWLRWRCVDGIVTFGPARPAAPDATAGDGLCGDCRGCGCAVNDYRAHVYGERKCCPDCDHRPLPALRDVLAAAARDAEKVRRVEELRDALAETIAEAEAEAPGVRQIISPTVLLTWLDAALDGTS